MRVMEQNPVRGIEKRWSGDENTVDGSERKVVVQHADEFRKVRYCVKINRASLFLEDPEITHVA